MGCGTSHLAVLPEIHGLPDYCIRGATLTAEQRLLLTSSWHACIHGTKAWRASISTPDSTTAAASTAATAGTSADVAIAGPLDPVAASRLSSLQMRETLIDSPIVVFYDSFYSRLFELAPGARELFSGLQSQGRKLVKMVNVIVLLLDDSPRLVAELQSLADRHHNYGAKIEHYAYVGHALLYALEKCCGPEVWTPEVARAWLVAYSVIVEIMIPAQHKARQAAAARIAAAGTRSTSRRSSSEYHP